MVHSAPTGQLRFLDRGKTRQGNGYSASEAVERFERTFVTAVRRELAKVWVKRRPFQQIF